MDDVKVLVDNNEILVIEISDSDSVCYYAANTEFCKESKKYWRWFDEQLEKRNLYLFRKKNGDKFFIWTDKNNPRENKIVNENSEPENLSTLLKNFPNQEDLIMSLTGQNILLKAMKKVIRGLESPENLTDIDDLISNVKLKNPPGLSEIFIEFKNFDELFKMLGLNDDDSHFYSAINNSYSGWEFFDDYGQYDNFREGFWDFVWKLNDDNKKTLEEIATILFPQEEFNLDKDKYLSNLSDLLIEFFDNEMSEIISTYVTFENYARNEAAVKQIDDEIQTYLNELGFSLWDDKVLKTTVGNLLMWSARIGLYGFDIKSLLEGIFSSESNKIGGWMDNSSDFYDDSLFDESGYNSRVSRILDSMKEKIEDDYQNKFSEFMKLVNEIRNKFSLNKWYELPKDSNIRYRITGFDKETNKIIVLIANKRKGEQTTYKFSKDNFYKFLYQPELFNN